MQLLSCEGAMFSSDKLETSLSVERIGFFFFSFLFFLGVVTIWCPIRDITITYQKIRDITIENQALGAWEKK